MYCPQCSQQQISDEMRFCSRCGFPLEGVRELMAGGGALTAREEDKLESRRAVALRGARFGVLLMLGSLPLAAFAVILTAIDDDLAFFFIVPVLIMVVGFFRTLFGIFCQGRTKRKDRDAEPKALPTSPYRPPEQLDTVTTPIQLLQGRETAEVRQPASVTENTTRLLDEDAHASRTI